MYRYIFQNIDVLYLLYIPCNFTFRYYCGVDVMLKNDLNDAANIDITLEDARETLFAIEILMSIPIYAYIHPRTPDITYP